MSILHYPGMVLTLVAVAFLGGMLALSLRLPQGLWRLTVAIALYNRRLASRAGRVARRVLAATRRRPRRAPCPLSRPALRLTFPLSPWRDRPRLVVLIADPAGRRARTNQLRDALGDLLRARPCPLPATLTVEVTSEARRSGVAYVAYLDRSRAPGSAHIRLAAFDPDRTAIDVDVQHTHLADLFQYFDGDPAATFVGLPAADPSSPIIGESPLIPPAGALQRSASRSGAMIAGPPPALATAPPAPADGVGRGPDEAARPEAVPAGPPNDFDPDIPYGDQDAPAA